MQKNTTKEQAKVHEKTTQLTTQPFASGSRFGNILAKNRVESVQPAKALQPSPRPAASVSLVAQRIAQMEAARDAASAGSGKFQGRGPWEPQTKFSDEQDEIINCAAKTIVANAFAGTGKTTTAIGFAARRKSAKILYMPFGKTVQLEAQKRFPPNTWCQTINSAAWEAADQRLRSKLSNLTPLIIRDEMNLRTNRQAGLALRVLNRFMSSADHEFKPKHTDTIVDGWRASDAEAADALAIARMAWRRMTDTGDKLPLPHDALLKLWSLKKPRLDYDYIIFDEAQDTNEVTADIINQQDHATRLYIGDRHQSIYGFRGAMNAMEGMSANKAAAHLNLSQTWRFGPEIANIANLILGELKGEKTPIVGMGKDRKWTNGCAYTKLARTNAQLFRDAALRQGEGIHWAGQNGIKGYNIERMTQAYNFFSGQECTDPVLRKFSSWAEAQSYAEESKDAEIRMLVQVVDEFRHDTPDLVRAIVLNEVPDAGGSDIVFTTAHKAKGLDWDFVQIADDFHILEDTEEVLAKDPLGDINDQEINLLYVAATRAKSALQLNSETKKWIEDLDKHRLARNLASQKLEKRREASRSFFQRAP